MDKFLHMELIINDHYHRPLNPDLYWCKWLQWIWYTLVSRKSLASHNPDCSPSCTCSWQHLGDVLLSCSTNWGIVWLVWWGCWQTFSPWHLYTDSVWMHPERWNPVHHANVTKLYIWWEEILCGSQGYIARLWKVYRLYFSSVVENRGNVTSSHSV